MEKNIVLKSFVKYVTLNVMGMIGLSAIFLQIPILFPKEWEQMD